MQFDRFCKFIVDEVPYAYLIFDIGICVSFYSLFSHYPRSQGLSVIVNLHGKCMILIKQLRLNMRTSNQISSYPSTKI